MDQAKPQDQNFPRHFSQRSPRPDLDCSDLYLLLAFIKFQTQYQFTLLHFTRVLKEALFQKTDIIALLKLSPNRFKLPHEPDGQMVLLKSDFFIRTRVIQVWE